MASVFDHPWSVSNSVFGSQELPGMFLVRKCSPLLVAACIAQPSYKNIGWSECTSPEMLVKTTSTSPTIIFFLFHELKLTREIHLEDNSLFFIIFPCTNKTSNSIFSPTKHALNLSPTKLTQILLHPVRVHDVKDFHYNFCNTMLAALRGWLSTENYTPRASFYKINFYKLIEQVLII